MNVYVVEHFIYREGGWVVGVTDHLKPALRLAKAKYPDVTWDEKEDSDGRRQWVANISRFEDIQVTEWEVSRV